MKKKEEIQRIVIPEKFVIDFEAYDKLFKY